jgi:rare lipoprotein A
MKSMLFAGALLPTSLLGLAYATDSKADECGLASFYATASKATASGEDTLPENFTAAHRTLPFGTQVRVENKKNGRSTVVRITDRGPTIDGRIIDISPLAAHALDMSGLAQVCLSIVATPESEPIIRK